MKATVAAVCFCFEEIVKMRKICRHLRNMLQHIWRSPFWRIPINFNLTPSRGNGFGCAEHETDPLDFDGLKRAEFWELGGAPAGVRCPP